MTDVDDTLWNHLIEHHGADRAQLCTTATPRTRHRPIAIGMVATGLAIAAVATVAVASSGSAPTNPGGPRLAPAALGGKSGAENTAYIIKRVRAKIAGDDDSGTASYGLVYAGGNLNSNGSLVNLGWKMNAGYGYVAPDGADYTRLTNYFEDGGPAYTSIDQFAPDGTDTETIVNESRQTYYQTRFSGVATTKRYGGSAASLSQSEVRQELDSGQVSQQGTSTIDGTPAIVLSVKPDPSTTPQMNDTVYVDAQTYAPLRSVVVGPRYLSLIDWMPATPANIALVKDDTVPAGYTRAANYNSAFTH